MIFEYGWEPVLILRILIGFKAILENNYFYLPVCIDFSLGFYVCFFRTVVVCKFENNVNLLFDFMFKVLLKVCKEENIKFFWSFGGSKSGMITPLALYRLGLSRILIFLLFKSFVKTIESILCLFCYVVRHKWIRQGQLSTWISL